MSISYMLHCPLLSWHFGVFCRVLFHLMLINRAKKNAIYTVNKVKKKSILNSEHYRTLYKRKVKEKLLFSLS